MTQPRMRATALDFAALRAELGVTADFSDEVTAEAAAAVDRRATERTDRRDLELVTIDPPGSLDLDQALRVTADGDGFLVQYAIADVAALVVPGGAVDAESRRRGETLYFPDGNVPLHPRVLSEGAGSLLADQDRLAVLWTVRVAADGEVIDAAVERAMVRSRARLDYAGVSADAAAGKLHPSVAALHAFGEARAAWSLARGAVMLDLPDQEVVPNEAQPRDRAWSLRLAPSTPADRWNAQVSLLVGMCAATMMRAAGVGLFRTLPAASEEAVGELRAVAKHLRATWPDGATAGQFLAGLPSDEPSTLALMSAAAKLMGGAGYRALAPGEQVPDADLVHAAVGGLYAHVTAPLRRLADRFATEVCLAVTAGKAVPEWAAQSLVELPEIMTRAGREGNAASRRSVDLAEAVVLADQIGARFDATVLRDRSGRRPAEIFIAEPAIIGPCDNAPAAGSRCTVEVAEADPVAGTVRFTVV